MAKVDFKLPPGWHPPEGNEAGDIIECVCEVELKNGGRACLVSLDDVSMPGYADREDKKYKPGMEQSPGEPRMQFPDG